MSAYTPYDGSSKPFSIGLSPLNPDRWIEPDDDLARYLGEKQRLADERYDDIFRAAGESIDSQQECLDLLLGHLLQKHSGLYSRSGGRLSVAGHVVDIEDQARPPLFRAGSLIQDDLVILRRKPDGWTIVAAHLAFPSSWSLAEKFMQPMDKVHAHVPGFQAGTRNATIVNRVFDNLQPDLPAKRFNWSINWRYALYHPVSVRPAADPAATGIDVSGAFVRVERQTLRRLPATGDIVFTIRIYLDPVKAFATSENGQALANALADQLEGLTAEQVAYKGLAERRADLVTALRSFSS
ncbi:DUF3445 domain-containing protein [Ciceribacter sp. L1K23]|uniref:heme-dependent oxidative N-demethylase family protein n=1 Tax=Ciceribacter sp. L1K23 TaxID=2820276 RepID=UPI001B8229F2|nr:DUF3445 domain-containing protein [Ciceribacter sp. L1K23]MBR0558236.1 DUF3445 domain-containing protein [Ciceribacter sp. L1K23]